MEKMVQVPQSYLDILSSDRDNLFKFIEQEYGNKAAWKLAESDLTTMMWRLANGKFEGV